MKLIDLEFVGKDDKCLLREFLERSQFEQILKSVQKGRIRLRIRHRFCSAVGFAVRIINNNSVTYIYRRGI